ncbi:acetyltransferase [Streptomyces sp. SPB074]|nr:acetyltransferase [Streptomyces sp. SPB074]
MPPHVRPCRSADHDALAEIRVRTAHLGADARPHYRAPSVLPVLFAHSYAAFEPELCFVLDDGEGRAVGYVLGTADTDRFADRFRTEWLPLHAERYPLPAGPPSDGDAMMAVLLHHPERLRVPALKDYPAHLHIDLLPAHQRRGHGRTLLRAHLGALAERGVSRVHLGMVTANTPARAFYDRLGFHEIPVPEAGELTYLGRGTGEAERGRRGRGGGCARGVPHPATGSRLAAGPHRVAGPHAARRDPAARLAPPSASRPLRSRPARLTSSGAVPPGRPAGAAPPGARSRSPSAAPAPRGPRRGRGSGRRAGRDGRRPRRGPAAARTGRAACVPPG